MTETVTGRGPSAPTSVSTLVTLLVEQLQPLSGVRALAWGGSHASHTADDQSDIDLYVFVDQPLPLAARRDVVAACGGAQHADLGMTHWGAGDMWIHPASRVVVDLIYFETGWMSEQVEALLARHEPRLGYTTCFLHTLRQSKVLADPSGWLDALRSRIGAYPEALRRNIIRHNREVLRDTLPSYENQIDKALGRGDPVSVNHRVAGLLASYFDVLFAFNRELHPGEKRLLHFARQRCPRLPVDMESDVRRVLSGAATQSSELRADVTRLLDRLDALLDSDAS
jgi:hypothetical protein